MKTKNPREGYERKPAPQYAYRAILAILIALLIVAYTAAVLFGRIPEERKLNTVDLGFTSINDRHNCTRDIARDRQDTIAQLEIFEVNRVVARI